MTTTVIAGCFHFHIEWDNDGQVGYDQHGRRWLNKSEPKPDKWPALIQYCELITNTIEEIGKLKTNS